MKTIIMLLLKVLYLNLKISIQVEITRELRKRSTCSIFYFKLVYSIFKFQGFSLNARNHLSYLCLFLIIFV